MSHWRERERKRTHQERRERKKKKYFCLCDKEEESESIKTNQSTCFSKKKTSGVIVDLKLEIDQEVVAGLKEKWNNKKCDNLSKYRSKVDHHHHQHYLLQFVYSKLFCASSEKKMWKNWRPKWFAAMTKKQWKR